jgi:hypothetical protein
MAMREHFRAVQGLRVDRVVSRGRIRDDEEIAVDSDLESGFAHRAVPTGSTPSLTTQIYTIQTDRGPFCLPIEVIF